MSNTRQGVPPLWPGTLAELREDLRARGLRLTKRLGQNFMVDPNLARAVVRAAGVGEGDVVLEVGPGAGHLSAAILETGATVVAVEIDAGLCAMLREPLCEGQHGEKRFRRPIRLLRGSVLAKGDVLNPEVVEALREEMDTAGREAFRIASNLPYNIAATFLVALARSAATTDLPWSGGAVTLQREVADRLAARAGTKEYGALSILWQLQAQGRIERTVPPDVFWPRPKVESALFTIAPRGDKGGDKGDCPLDSRFTGFVKALFSSRRKVLRSAVAKALPSRPRAEIEAALAAAGIDPAARAEDVAPEGVLALWRRLVSV